MNCVVHCWKADYSMSYNDPHAAEKSEIVTVIDYTEKCNHCTATRTKRDRSITKAEYGDWTYTDSI